jgi:REP element-mobilizing transposase RayT
MRPFDDNALPLAYLITFRTYGTWLHGDARGSMDRKHYNIYRTPRIQPCLPLEQLDRSQLAGPSITLGVPHRAAVEKAIREVCKYRGYTLRAINARTNHVHAVVSAACKPEPVLNAFKAYATRCLRKEGLTAGNLTPWARHGSTPYLWTERDIERAINYVLYGQGEALFKLDEDD